jgi:2-haloacid dehalogenase
LRTIGNHYKDFWQVTEDALNNAASEMRLPLTKAECQRLMGKYETLPPWPDVPETLSGLRRRNI